MRIIGGEARGRRIVAPEGLDTRPILDLLKQRLFDILGPTLADLIVWDLFAGAGSLGLEALSRGARHCCFIEQSAAACRVIAQNLDTLGFADRAQVMRADAFSVMRSTRRLDESPGLVFLDPPFPLAAAEPSRLAELVDAIFGEILTADGRLVLRLPRGFSWQGPLPVALAEADSRTQGVNVLLIASR